MVYSFFSIIKRHRLIIICSSEEGTNSKNVLLLRELLFLLVC